MHLPHVAAHVGLSSAYFDRMFSTAVGCGLREYIRNVRLGAGLAALADTEDSVKQIAFTVGYGSVSAFGRDFKNRYGLTPGGYRRRVGRRPEANRK